MADELDRRQPPEAGLSRRELLKRGAVGAGGVVVSGALAQPIWARPRSDSGAAANTIKIGFISPITGPAAGFGEGDPYVVGLARHAFAKGLTIGGTHYAIQIITKDSQSTPAHCAQVANELIHGDNVDLLLATSTPESVNPASDAAEAAGLPAVSTVVPWEAWYFGRGAKPGKPSPFKYTYHFSFGTQQFADAYTHLWPQVKTNKRVGVMWPNDADGNAIRQNLGPLLEKAGYKIVDPGGYQDGTTDYSSQIATFKKNNCQIFNTFPIPPDFTTFWRQAAQQGYTKMVKIAQIAKTGLFPSQVLVLGNLGFNLASGAYWAPYFPYRSPLTGLTSKQLGDGYTKKTGKEWNQQLGASLALFDVAAAVLKKSGNPKDKTMVANAMKTLKVSTISGDLHWGAGGPHNPVPNCVTTPIVGGQWVKTKGRFRVDFRLCEHSYDHRIKVQSKLKPY
jgi:branched-chain amino acid transport system substrate-binding protein